MTVQEFTDEQKNYLQGFVSGVETARAARGLATLANTQAAARAGGTGAHIEPLPAGPEALHIMAQDRVIAEGKKLCAEEQAKRKKNPLDMWDDLQEYARERRYPKGTDILLFKFHGMFYVAPAQDSFMCRLRIPAGLLKPHQLRAIADIAQHYGGGYAHVTTRANMQIREIQAENIINVLTSLQEAGLSSRGSGADNIRNITASPTAGIDAQELIDTSALAKAMHHFILNHREMYGLPRKFNIAFDGGGAISALEDTNDIGFSAVRVDEGKEVPAGVYFRLQLGGITGHRDFARDTGVLLTPDECIPVAAALVRVFIDHGDRTDRTKARLKYVLDRWGMEKYLEETEKHLPFKLRRFPLAECMPRPPIVKQAHIGFHAQRQPSLYYCGVVLPVGKLTVAQMHGLAALAERYGGGVRLTVWQNLLISDIPEQHLGAVKTEIETLGLEWRASSVRAGLVACTGNGGCKFAASDTKGQAMQIANYLETRVQLDQPINIHLTGCHHSCAQHYIGDIGLLGAKVEVGEELVEGYHVFVGGGYGEGRNIGRELLHGVAFSEIPALLEKMLTAYQTHRLHLEEGFQEFTARHSVEQLKALFEYDAAIAA